MCLAKEYNWLNPPKVREGFKVFIKTDAGKIRSLYFTDSPAVKRRWLTASLAPPISPDHSRQYIAGFHVYTNKHYALSVVEDWFNAVCHRVLVRDIITHGRQEMNDLDSHTVVCKQIYIMEEVTK